MKKLILSCIISTLLTQVAFGERMKSIAPWYLGETQKDNTLSKNESAFTIIFTGIEADGDFQSPPERIIFSCNKKQDTIEIPKDQKYNLKVKPGKYIFQFFVNSNYTEIKTDSIKIAGGYCTPLYINFQSSTTPVICDKPVIYVYPKDTEEINMQLDLKGELGFTYPAYDLGWNFVADPDGTIHMNNKSYNYLFWDGKTNIDNTSVTWDEGFVVDRDSLVSFFEEKLKLMGLNDKEIEDYITYWVPRMNVNEKNYIHFMFNDDYADYAALNVSPEPDKMFRVFMLWTKYDAATTSGITPQALEVFNREGFTVVEWGGAELEKIPVIFDEQVSN